MRKLIRISASIIAAVLIAASSPSGAECARLLFIGDVMAHEEQLKAAKTGDGYDFSPQFKRMLPLFAGGLVTANLETVFAGERAKYTGYPAFNTPDTLADALAGAGVDVVTVANNHILDRGESGLARTLDVLDASPLKWTGAARRGENRLLPLIIEHDGITIAFVNFTYGTNVPPKSGDVPASANYIRPADIKAAMAAARDASPDLIAACLHWGTEYVYAPNAADRMTAKLLIEEGADLVIGTHPHVLQPIEVVDHGGKKRLIAWSLGNFVSFQRTLPRERSIVLAVDVDRDVDGCSIRAVKAAPTWVSARREGGRRRFEVVYAGTGGRFNHAALPSGELQKARSAGKLALDFLGAQDRPDDDGFYTLWEAEDPSRLPSPRRKAPM